MVLAIAAASVIGGLGTPFSLILLVRLGRDPSVMGTDVISARLAVAGWIVAVVVGALGVLFLIGSALAAF